MRTPEFLQLHHDDHAAIRQELIEGLSAPQAHTSPKFLYDALGSRLFEAITELPEYYPTRTEAAIFAKHGAEMAACIAPHATLIDLGAGNCNKAAALFDRFAPKRYVAVDISVSFLRGALECLQRQYPELEMLGVGMDFSSRLLLPPQALHAGEPCVLFYPGSSIGNFTPHDALRFLQDAHRACGQGDGSGLLIGVDLVKDAVELQAAYDDALGVTAAFNRNLLLHINRLAGSDLALGDWRHMALFNTQASRIEMHLLANRDLTVTWPGGGRNFAKDERIHTENSYKWTVPGFAQLLEQAGFATPQVWTDAPDVSQGRFAVMWARAR